MDDIVTLYMLYDISLRELLYVISYHWRCALFLWTLTHHLTFHNKPPQWHHLQPLRHLYASSSPAPVSLASRVHTSFSPIPDGPRRGCRLRWSNGKTGVVGGSKRCVNPHLLHLLHPLHPLVHPGTKPVPHASPIATTGFAISPTNSVVRKCRCRTPMTTTVH